MSTTVSTQEGSAYCESPGIDIVMALLATRQSLTPILGPKKPGTLLRGCKRLLLSVALITHRGRKVGLRAPQGSA